MTRAVIPLSLDKDSTDKLEQLVAKSLHGNRSRVMREAIDTLWRLHQRRDTARQRAPTSKGKTA
jgi:Arc/MetJ-type ribon-helix-helix transcriptional regulator